MEKEFVCLTEGARVLGLDVKTFKKVLAGATGLRTTRIGRKVLINKKKLVEYFDTHDIIRY